VVGSGGTGKTTFSVSASAFAGDTIPADKPRVCHDVAVLQADIEGVAGAWRAGFEPAYVYDLSNTATWTDYQSKLVEALRDLQPLFKSGDVKFLVVDLAHPNRLIQESVSPNVQKDWKGVASHGAKLFTAFAGLSGVTIIGNAQLKSSQAIGETAQAASAAEARAVGGQRSMFSNDLYKGVGSVWVENSSLQISRELKRVRDAKTGQVVPTFFSHTQSNNKFEAKSRFRDVLKPTEDGNITLHALLKRGYGEAL